MTPWFALYVTHDKRACRHLREAGIEPFAPTYQRLVGHGHKVRLEPSALIPGYVFIQVAFEDLAVALACENVVYVLSSAGVPRAAPHADITALQALCASGRMDERLPHQRSRARGTRARGLAALKLWFEAEKPALAVAA